MPIYIAIFCVLPLLAGLIPEYLVCRFTRRRWWKVLPPLAVAAITALVTAGRLSVWESDVSPVTQLLFVPGVPAAFALAGGCGSGCGAPGWSRTGGEADVPAPGPGGGGALPGRAGGV